MEEKVTIGKKFKRFCFRWLFRLSLAAAIFGVMYKADVVWALIQPSPKVIERVVEVLVPAPKKTFDELVQEIPAQYGIPTPIIQVMLHKESGGRMDAIRFESHHMARVKKLSSNPDQQRMYASSHCALQIMGWWAPEYKIKWSDLYIPEVCLRVGSDIMRKCLDRHKKSGSKVSQIKRAGECYNGAAAYGEDLAQKVGEMLINEMEM